MVKTLEQIEITQEDVKNGEKYFTRYKNPINGLVFLIGVSVPSLSKDGAILSDSVITDAQRNHNKKFGFMILDIDKDIKTPFTKGTFVALNNTHIQTGLEGAAALSRVVTSEEQWDIKMDAVQFENLASAFKTTFLKNLKKEYVFIAISYHSLACSIDIE